MRMKKPHSTRTTFDPPLHGAVAGRGRVGSITLFTVTGVTVTEKNLEHPETTYQKICVLAAGPGTTVLEALSVILSCRSSIAS